MSQEYFPGKVGLTGQVGRARRPEVGKDFAVRQRCLVRHFCLFPWSFGEGNPEAEVLLMSK